MQTSPTQVRSDSWGSIVAAAALASCLSSGGAAQEPAAGLSPIRAQRIPNQTLTGFPVQENDHFAWSLAAGDFNGDGIDDLASGIPEDDGPTTAPVTDGGALIVS